MQLNQSIAYQNKNISQALMKTTHMKNNWQKNKRKSKIFEES
jgi:hypothetical protein